MRSFIPRVEPYLTPLLAFSGLFFVSLILLSLAYGALSSDGAQLVASHLLSLTAAGVASAICVFLIEKGMWDLGILVSPARAVRGVVRGITVASLLVLSTDAAIVLLGDYGHVPGAGINWRVMFALLLPAAFGEELLFRGYVLQKLYRLSPGYAIGVTSLLFAIAHGGNPAVGPLAFANIMLAGVLLGLMWVYDRSLWMPTWGHFAWNVVSGPVLGHELSGLDLGPTLLAEVDKGPVWITGGDFGIEASVVLTVVEVLAIVLLSRRIRVRDHALGQEVAATGNASTTPDTLSGNNEDQLSEVNSP